MHAADLKSSPRLQRVLEFLCDGEGRTTRDIVIGADVCAVNSCVSELRDNGFDIKCRQVGQDGRRVWIYELRNATEARTALDRIAKAAGGTRG